MDLCHCGRCFVRVTSYDIGIMSWGSEAGTAARRPPSHNMYGVELQQYRYLVYVSCRYPLLNCLSSPPVLSHNDTMVMVPCAGQVLENKLSKCLLAREKLHSELRSKGHTSLDEVFAVVLEHTGSFSVITKGVLMHSTASTPQLSSGVSNEGTAALTSL